MILDPRTLLVVATLFSGLMTLVLRLVHRSTPDPVPGLHIWSRATLLAFVTGCLYCLRPNLPRAAGFLVPNACVFLVFILYLGGTYEFLGRQMPWRRWLSLAFAFWIGQAWFVLGDDSFRGRILMVTGFLTIVCTAHAWLMGQEAMRRRERTTPGHWFSTFWIGALVLIFGLRWLHALFRNEVGSDLLAQNMLQAVYASAFTFGLVMLTIGMVLQSTERLREMFEHHATLDALTGVFNRRVVLERLHAEDARARRYGRSLSVLLLDLDHFKLINDKHGHQTGDLVLQEFARRVRAALRPADVFGRLGGEEFLVILPETTAESARTLAVRLLEEVSRVGAPDLPVCTVSAGIAQWAGDEDSAGHLLERADQALYASKAAGRNRVEVASARKPPAAAAPVVDELSCGAS